MQHLSKKSIVVTGATSGIGLAAVKNLIKTGAFVIGVGRSEDRILKAREQILAESPDRENSFIFLKADFGEQDQVRRLAMDITHELSTKGFGHLDVLVNNAGLYLERKQKNKSGIEMTFAVNHLAAFYLTNLLLPTLTQSENGRVLTVSSYSHRTTPLMLNRVVDPWPYIGLLAYKRSKLCNVLFTYELNRRCKQISAFAVDPGLVNTAIASKGTNGISHWVWHSRRKKGTSADVPAQTIRYLACEPVIDRSQGYYFRDSKPISPSQKSQNPELARELWALSNGLLKITWPDC